jgi:transcriptional regulator with XRE-family HTH domain
MSNRESRPLFDTRQQISNQNRHVASGKSFRYVVDDDWRNRVEQKLVEKGWSRADLARESRVGRSTITDLLNGKQHHCVGLPKIHHALGWDPPLPPILSNDASELFGIWDRLNEFERGRLLERARSIFEQQAVALKTSRKP